MSIRNTLDNLLFTSATTLFKAYGITVHETATERKVHTPICAAIGFAGPALTGTVMLCAEPPLVRASKPLPENVDHEWLAELVNQLMGRIKNRLLAFGIEVHPSTPLILRSERVAPLGHSGDLAGVVLHHPDGGSAIATIDHDVRDPAKLANLTRDGQPAIPREGDVILF